MQTVFEAVTGLEAHMIKNLLAVNGVESEVLGEHLQGAVGELQAHGIVRVVVADPDYEDAKRIIADWEISQPKTTQETYRRKGVGYGGVLLSFIAGVVITLILVTTPITNDGIDYNDDGVLDERWEFYGDLLSLSESDRNIDGLFDIKWQYDLQGLLKSSSFDNDFDGRHEWWCRYKGGNAVWCLRDSDNDGFNEYREDYEFGVLTTVSMFNPSSKKLKKKQYFKGNRLRQAEVDLDDDGVLETVYNYDEYEQPQ